MTHNCIQGPALRSSGYKRAGVNLLLIIVNTTAQIVKGYKRGRIGPWLITEQGRALSVMS